MTGSSGFSVVIPTFNMAEHLPSLWASLVRSGVAAVADEILFVDDGSTDGTREAVERICAGGGDTKIRLHTLGGNRGRFIARYEGAKAAVAARILFLDSRVEVKDGFGDALRELLPKHESLMGLVDIDVTRSVFCLYWQRSHETIFRRHFRDTREPLLLTPENFDRYLKGTGVYLCPRDLLLQVCEKYRDTPLLSDDTLLMKEMVKTSPILIDPRLRIQWVPREEAKGFLARLWERGPSFVEYHVFRRRGAFFWAVMAGLLGIVTWFGVFAASPAVALAAFFMALAGIALSTVLMTRSPLEFFRMAPLHVAVVFTFGFGVLRGLAVNFRRWLRGTLPPEAS